MATSIVSNSTAATFANSPQKTGEPVDRLKIYSGKGLEFDGVSDYITSNPDFLVNSTATTAMTVAVWVNVDDISSNHDVIAVLDTNQNSKYLGNYSGAISFTMYNNDYSDVIGQKTDDVVLIERQWHRIVATYDGSQTDAGFKIYMDGALIASSASNSIFSANINNSLILGRTDRSSSTADFAGKMSDFQVWDTVWSLADVTYDYLNPEKLISSQNPTDDLVSNLRVWYPMNDTGITNPQTVVFDAANTGGLETNLVTSAGTEASWGTLSNGTLTRTSATGFTFTSTSDGSENAYLSAAGILSEDLSVGYYKISLDVTQTTPFGDEQSIRWYKTGSSAETLSLTAGSNVFYRPIDTANNNSQLFFNASAIGNDITISNFSIQKVKQGFHGTTTFLGDDLFGKGNPVDDNSDWSAGTGWAADASNSKLTGTSTTANINATNTTSVADGDVVSITFTVSNYSAGSVRFIINGNTNGTARDADGTYTEEVTISNTAGGSKLYFDGVTAFTGDISDITLKKVGIATGWTDADQQQYIPQTAFMDGCIKSIFNGSSSYVDFGSASALDDVFVGGATVSFWIYLDLDNDPTSNGGFIHKIGNGNQGWQIYVDTYSSSKYKFRFTQKWNNEDLIQEAHVLKSQQWNHIVVTYDASSNSNRASFYLNGAAQTFSVLSSSYDASDSTSISSDASDNLEIGRKNTSGTYQNMIMDDISIFSSSLTETQAQELYNNGLPLNATNHSQSSNLIGYWRNNVLSSAGTWEDLSTNDNHGTPNNLDDYIFFQQGITSGKCTQGYSNNIVHPSKGSIHFLGQEYAAFPGERIINLDGDFTIEFWAKKTQLHVGSLTDNMLFGSGSNQIRIPDGVSGGKMSTINYRDGGVNSSFSIHSDNRKSLYEWFHVTIVKQQGTLKPYIDAVGTGNGTLSSTGQMQIKLIGAYSVINNQMYKGFLDDLRIYDKALSAAEIAKNYKSGKSQHKNS